MEALRWMWATPFRSLRSGLLIGCALTTLLFYSTDMPAEAYLGPVISLTMAAVVGIIEAALKIFVRARRSR